MPRNILPPSPRPSHSPAARPECSARSRISEILIPGRRQDESTFQRGTLPRAGRFPLRQTWRSTVVPCAESFRGPGRIPCDCRAFGRREVFSLELPGWPPPPDHRSNLVSRKRRTMPRTFRDPGQTWVCFSAPKIDTQFERSDQHTLRHAGCQSLVANYVRL
jgi:hypothetical protein